MSEGPVDVRSAGSPAVCPEYICAGGNPQKGNWHSLGRDERNIGGPPQVFFSAVIESGVSESAR